MLVWSARVRRPPVDGIRVIFPLVERFRWHSGETKPTPTSVFAQLLQSSPPPDCQVANRQIARLDCAYALACIVGTIRMHVCLVLLCLRREECVQNPMRVLPTIEYRCPSHRHGFRCCHVRRSPHGPRVLCFRSVLVAILADDVKLTKLKPRTTSRTPTT